VYCNPKKSAKVPFLKVTAVDKTFWEIGVKEISTAVSLGSIIRQKKYGVAYLNKKFWEELIAYFPLIRHGPHRKRPLQQF
jgi:hypothetical protein